jgi:ABC-type lipoprotein release transport system permease subunit
VAVRFLAHLLWGVRPVDPVTFAATAALLLLVAAAASLAPALRVLRLDPARTLRNE